MSEERKKGDRKESLGLQILTGVLGALIVVGLLFVGVFYYYDLDEYYNRKEEITPYPVPAAEVPVPKQPIVIEEIVPVAEKKVEEPRHHLVKKGEWLIKIARLEGCADWKAIAEMNHLSDPYRIFPGHRLVLPLECTGVETKPDPIVSERQKARLADRTPTRSYVAKEDHVIIVAGAECHIKEGEYVWANFSNDAVNNPPSVEKLMDLGLAENEAKVFVPRLSPDQSPYWTEWNIPEPCERLGTMVGRAKGSVYPNTVFAMDPAQVFAEGEDPRVFWHHEVFDEEYVESDGTRGTKPVLKTVGLFPECGNLIRKPDTPYEDPPTVDLKPPPSEPREPPLRCKNPESDPSPPPFRSRACSSSDRDPEDHSSDHASEDSAARRADKKGERQQWVKIPGLKPPVFVYDFNGTPEPEESERKHRDSPEDSFPQAGDDDSTSGDHHSCSVNLLAVPDQKTLVQVCRDIPNACIGNKPICKESSQ